MALDTEQLIYDAKILAERLKDNESDADNLISQTQMLKERVDAMKQYQDDLTELNEVARHRPRSTLIHEIAKENRLIRELQQENYDLRTSLEEYQSALEMIMSKYREQISQLVAVNSSDNNNVHLDQSQEVDALIDKVCEMAAVMQEAVNIDDVVNSVDVNSLVEKLQQENHGLRELLAISTTDLRRIVAVQDDKEVQTLYDSATDSSDLESTPNSSSVIAVLNGVSGRESNTGGVTATPDFGANSAVDSPSEMVNRMFNTVRRSTGNASDRGNRFAAEITNGIVPGSDNYVDDADKSDTSDVTLEGDPHDDVTLEGDPHDDNL